MMGFLNFLGDVTGVDSTGTAVTSGLSLEGFDCTQVQPIFNAVKFVVRIIQIAVPFALVIWGSLDFFKALIAGDEKEMKAKRKPFISRLVAAIVILVLPWLVQLVANQIVGDDTANYWKCFKESRAVIDFSSWNKQKSNEAN